MRNLVGHTFSLMMPDTVHGGVKRKLYTQDFVADLDGLVKLVETAQSDPAHITRRLTSDILFNWKEYLGARYTITRNTLNSMADADADDARWCMPGGKAQFRECPRVG